VPAANRSWEVVRRLVGRGIERDFLDPTASAVFTNFPRPAEEKQRDRVLTHDEIRRVFEALRREPPVTAIFWRLLIRGRPRWPAVGRDGSTAVAVNRKEGE
jgi:hypothetical protein